MPGTIEQREQAKREIRARNQKDIFELPEELQILGTPIRIFNIGPMKHQRSMGSYGQFLIKACEPGRRYSEPTEIPYITNDPVHIDMNQMAYRHDSGKKLALDILGVGQFHTPGEDLTKWGVFISAEEFPTDEEIHQAQAKLNKTYDWLIQEADSYWNQGPSEYKNVTELHRIAARERGQLNKPWARAVVETSKCPACAAQIDPAAAICPHCRTALNIEKVIGLKVPGYEYLWKPRKPNPEQPA